MDHKNQLVFEQYRTQLLVEGTGMRGDDQPPAAVLMHHDVLTVV